MAACLPELLFCKQGVLFKNTKKILCCFLSLLLIVGVISGCSYKDDGSASEGSLHAAESDDDSSWAVYWYLCGSDLESDGGAATSDLAKLLNVQLPENVQVIILPLRQMDLMAL